jgi:hypothetical protein
MSKKLALERPLAALDNKVRNFPASLNEQEAKEFSTYLMLSWSASVEGPYDIQQYYLRAANERVNMHFFDLGRHPKLQWLACTTVSPGLGRQRHYWVKSRAKKNKLLELACSLLPSAKVSDVELLLKLQGVEYFRNLAREHAWSDQQIAQLK